jgi:hypothetical protein
MREQKPEVVILGGGASSIFAFYGALAAGFTYSEVQIWADKLSYPPGAFWLHQVPPNAPKVCDPEPMVIRLTGSAEEYSRKQWGTTYPSSAQRLVDQSPEAYNPHVVLPALWKTCNVKPMSKHWTLTEVELLSQLHRYVIVTFPITPLAKAAMAKHKIPIYFASAPGEGSQNICLYNGDPDFPWVRMTRAFGQLSVEYPHFYASRLEEVKAMEEKFEKEFGLSSGKVMLAPELHPETFAIYPVLGNNILLTGRWATLNRKALSHDSYLDVYYFLKREEGL